MTRHHTLRLTTKQLQLLFDHLQITIPLPNLHTNKDTKEELSNIQIAAGITLRNYKMKNGDK